MPDSVPARVPTAQRASACRRSPSQSSRRRKQGPGLLGHARPVAQHDPSRGRGGGREEGRRRGQVRFDVPVDGLRGPGAHGPDAVRAIVHHRAGAPQRSDGHRKVRAGRDGRPFVDDADALVVARRRQQQPGDELAGRAGVQADGCRRAPPRDRAPPAESTSPSRRRPAPERLHQRAQRPFPHPRVPVEDDIPAGQRRDRRQEAGHRARVAAVDSGLVAKASGAARARSPASRARRCPAPRRRSRPRARKPPAMRRVSRARSGRRSRLVPSARAARTRLRFVSDLEPGTDTTASTGDAAVGAGQTSTSSTRGALPEAGEPCTLRLDCTGAAQAGCVPGRGPSRHCPSTMPGASTTEGGRQRGFLRWHGNVWSGCWPTSMRRSGR